MKFKTASWQELKSSTRVARPTLVVLSLPEWKDGSWLSQLPAALRKRVEIATARLKEPLSAGSRLCVQGAEKGEEDLIVAILPKEEETFHILTFARDSLKEALQPWAKSFAIAFASGDERKDIQVADAFGSALATRIALMPVFGKREAKVKPFQLKEMILVGASEELAETFETGFVIGDGTNLARYLAMLPPNVLDSGSYGQRIQKVAREYGLKTRFYSNKELKRMGAGAFTAVDQANPESQGGIWEVTYAPAGSANKRPITLVGKGMCFDTGGYDVKINGGMLTMKGDMQGSAVALAGVVTAARLKLPYKMKAMLAVTENHISPRGYKADEVVTALNGITIEVINTDAEGRMVLADALALASQESPELIIDFATLTGSAVRAIGTRFSCGFTNQKNWHDRIREAGETSGERVWTFPIDSTYFKALESKVADTIQCVKSGSPDHIMAACFLSKFVKEGTPWVHIDLSASENSDGLAHVDSMFTGFGVRWTMEFLKNRH